MPELVSGLKCRLCGKLYAKQPLNFCTEDFGPLEVDYDYAAIGKILTRSKIESRPHTMWRYATGVARRKNRADLDKRTHMPYNAAFVIRSPSKDMSEGDYS